MPYTRGLRGSCIHYYHIYPPSIHWRYLVSNCNKGVLFSQAKTQRRLRTMSEFLSPCLALPLWRREEKKTRTLIFFTAHMSRDETLRHRMLSKSAYNRGCFFFFSLSLTYGTVLRVCRCVVLYLYLLDRSESVTDNLFYSMMPIRSGRDSTYGRSFEGPVL